MEYRDYYRILGVDRTANEKEIKRAYRRLARQHHPDVNPDDARAEERFKEINEAYEVLGDSEKRAKYDQLGASWQQWQRTGHDPGQFDWSRWSAGGPGGVRVEWGGDLGDLFGGSGAGAFSDFFRVIFGETGGGGRAGTAEDLFRRTTSQRVRSGQDLQADVEITLEEALHGTTRLLEQAGRRIRVRIPPGAKTGSKVRIPGRGGEALGSGKSGDLYLNITVKPHRVFTREGDDLRCTVDVDLYTAVLGGEARVSTLGRDVSLRIPAGTSSGKTFRLRGEGMSKPRNSRRRGDLLVTVQVQIPQELSPKERELFQELAGLQGRG
jgi:curved DNA-binding protein